MRQDSDQATSEQLLDEIHNMASGSNKEFFDTSIALAKLNVMGGIDVPQLSSDLSISRRQCYNLISVGEFVSRFKIEKAEANQVGVTKLGILANHFRGRKGIAKRKVKGLLKRSRQFDARTLKMEIAGQKADDLKAVVFHMSSTDRVLLEQALIEFGAKKARNGGLLGKDKALMRLMKVAGWDDAE